MAEGYENNPFLYTTGKVSVNTNYIDRNELYYTRSGNVVCVSGYFLSKVEIPADGIIMTLPYESENQISGFSASNTGTLIRCMRGTQNIIFSNFSTPANTWMYLSFAYVTSDPL